MTATHLSKDDWTARIRDVARSVRNERIRVVVWQVSLLPLDNYLQFRYLVEQTVVVIVYNKADAEVFLTASALKLTENKKVAKPI